jgi:hypothetical protein
MDLVPSSLLLEIPFPFVNIIDFIASLALNLSDIRTLTAIGEFPVSGVTSEILIGFESVVESTNRRSVALACILYAAVEAVPGSSLMNDHIFF